MAKYFTLTWVPNPLATSQLLKYREKGSAMWTTSPGLTPANPLGTGVSSATLTTYAPNMIYQFQVDAICTGITGNSNVSEQIIYDKQTVTLTQSGGVITATQATMGTVSTIDYVLYSGNQSLQTVQATGLNPTASFAAVAPGTYVVKYRYGALVNAVTLYSDDVTQAGAYYTSDPITF